MQRLRVPSPAAQEGQTGVKQVPFGQQLFAQDKAEPQPPPNYVRKGKLELKYRNNIVSQATGTSLFCFLGSDAHQKHPEAGHGSIPL